MGGADSGEQKILVGHGTDPTANRFLLDGIEINEPGSLGQIPASLNFDAVQEIQVQTGTSDISSQTGGVTINFVTKRGGNRFGGSGSFYGKLFEFGQGDPNAYMQSQGYENDDPGGFLKGDLSAGGPILGHKLWFFTSLSGQRTGNTTFAGQDEDDWLMSGRGSLIIPSHLLLEISRPG